MGYSLTRYIAGIVLGRFFRFWLLAEVGQVIVLPWWALVSMALILASGGLIAAGSYYFKKTFHGEGKQQG
jgi:fucose permease